MYISRSRSETSAPSSSFCKFEKYLKSRRAKNDLNRPILAWKPISSVCQIEQMVPTLFHLLT
ncbi:hypothetical protein T09_14117 [Trichinella sp. T9]|nr:hypothetical protein T09_14117 [Trichinella sp. T9]